MRLEISLRICCLLAATAACTAGLARGEQTDRASREAVEIQLPNRCFAPGRGIDRGLSEDLARASTAVEGLVQLERLPLPAERAALAGKGVELRQFMGGTTYLARIKPGTELSQIGLVRWAGPVLPEDKILSPLWKREFESPRLAPSGPIKVVVRFRDDTSEDEAGEIIKRYDENARFQERTRTWLAEMDGAAILQLATEPAVRRIEDQPPTEFKPHSP